MAVASGVSLGFASAATPAEQIIRAFGRKHFELGSYVSGVAERNDLASAANGIEEALARVQRDLNGEVVGCHAELLDNTVNLELLDTELEEVCQYCCDERCDQRCFRVCASLCPHDFSLESFETERIANSQCESRDFGNNESADTGKRSVSARLNGRDQARLSRAVSGFEEARRMFVTGAAGQQLGAEIHQVLGSLRDRDFFPTVEKS